MLPDVLNQLKIVLVHTSHPGNIGACARAMKTMGLSQLTLVKPRFFPDARATELASNASDLLETAVVVDSLDEAIKECELIIGTSARIRTIPWPLLNAREGAVCAINAAAKAKVAIVFGREDSGLSNEELQKCHYHVTIPGNPLYDVLNLAQAVQIIAYECRMALTEGKLRDMPYEALATPDEVERCYAHMKQTLTDLTFYNPNAPKQLLPRFKRMFMRIQLEKQEVNILRGLWSAIDEHLKK